MNTKETLLNLITLITYYLEELNTVPLNDFIHGEITAYVEILELIQLWEEHKNYNLDFDIEKKYKI